MSFFQRNDVPTASLVFLLVAILQFLGSFLLIPVYLNKFSAEEFGINEIINRLALFVGIIISLRISGAMANIYFSMYSEADKRLFISSLAGFTVLTSFVAFFLLLAVGYYFSEIFPTDNGFTLFPHGLCALLTGIAANMIAPYIFFLKNERRLSSFLTISVFLIALNLMVQLIAIYHFYADFETVITLRSAVAVVQFFLMFTLYLFSFSLSIHWTMVRRALSYTVPLMPFLILNWLQLYYDRLFIGKHFGSIGLGAFSFIVILQSIQTTVTDVFENAIRPNLMSVFLKRNYHDGLLTKTQNQFVTGLVFTSSMLLFLTISLPLLTTNPLYLENAVLFMLIIPSGVIKGVSLLFMQQLIFKERSFELGILVAIHFLLLYGFYHLFGRQGNWETILWINIWIGASMGYVYFWRAQKVLVLPFRLSQFFLPFIFISMVLMFYSLIKYLYAPAKLFISLQFLMILLFTRNHLKSLVSKMAIKISR